MTNWCHNRMKITGPISEITRFKHEEAKKQRADCRSSQNMGDGAVCCSDNGLRCLPGANGTTGAQRFLAALSNRLASNPLRDMNAPCG